MGKALARYSVNKSQSKSQLNWLTNMKITDIQVHPVQAPGRTFVVVLVSTDDGIIGEESRELSSIYGAGW